jgi:hypothetical protein
MINTNPNNKQLNKMRIKDGDGGERNPLEELFKSIKGMAEIHGDIIKRDISPDNSKTKSTETSFDRDFFSNKIEKQEIVLKKTLNEQVLAEWSNKLQTSLAREESATLLIKELSFPYEIISHATAQRISSHVFETALNKLRESNWVVVDEYSRVLVEERGDSFGAYLFAFVKTN